jgi:ribose/xylose/arabinose/galactoside ABC-type transport system permease subunit
MNNIRLSPQKNKGVYRNDISPFIATLGMLFVGKGLALVVCNGQSVRSNLPDHFSAMMSESFIGIPVPIVMAIVGVAIFWILANKSLLGKYGLSMLNVLIFWQTVIKGIILIVAVTFNEKILVGDIGSKVSGIENGSSSYQPAV